MRLSFLLIFLLTISFTAHSQGKFNLYGEKGIESIVAKHIYFNENVKGFPGYRVQIFFESGNYSRNRAFGEKGRFMSLYPDVAAYVVFQEPYYKVRVGNFRNKLEAEAFKHRIIEQWPESYLIKDDIDMPGIFPPSEIR